MFDPDFMAQEWKPTENQSYPRQLNISRRSTVEPGPWEMYLHGNGKTNICPVKPRGSFLEKGSGLMTLEYSPFYTFSLGALLDTTGV